MTKKSSQLAAPVAYHASLGSACASGGGLSRPLLYAENLEFAGTYGVSRNNWQDGFVPAYRDGSSGRVVLSCFADGRMAPIHVLDGLPGEWVTARDHLGNITQIAPNVVAGFVRNGRFYTRAEAARSLGR